MYYKIPLYKKGDGFWFLTEADFLVYGIVDRITMTVSDQEPMVYYYVVVEGTDTDRLVCEKEVIPHNVNTGKPMYQVGEEVMYEYTVNKTGSRAATTGIIETIEVTYYDKDKYEINYFMEDDPDFWILESEIVCKVDAIPTVKKLVES